MAQLCVTGGAPRAAGGAIRSAAAIGWKPLALIAFAGWVLFVGAHHEPWFDEAQAWLLARDSSLWELLAHRIRYEGSPGLWHVLLWFAGRAGLGYGQIFLIPAACAIAGAAVVLWRAPFAPAIRLAIIGSYFFAYQYAVVARSYALDLLLIPLLAACFAQRLERPLRYGLLIALIANTNAHCFFAAAVLGAELAWAALRSRRWREPGIAGGLALALAGGLAAAITTLTPADCTALSFGDKQDPLMTSLHFLLDGLIDRLRPWRSDLPAAWELSLALYASIAALAASAPLFRRAGTLPLAAALAAALIGFTAAVYAAPWQSGLLFLFWIFCLWISWPAVPATAPARRCAGGVLALVCLAQLPQSVTSGLHDIRADYSSSRAAAAAVAQWRRAHPAGRIAGIGPWAFAVQPYFAQNIFANYHGGAARPSYQIWAKDEPWKVTLMPEDWALAMASRPELILASRIRIGPGPWETPPRCPDGFRPSRIVRAESWWRGRRYANDDYVLIERAPGAQGRPCLVSSTAAPGAAD